MYEEDDYGGLSDLVGGFLAPQDDEEAAKEQELLAGKQARLASQNAAFRSKQTQLRSINQLMEAQGQGPISEPEPGFVPRFLDTINTPHQWLAGATASLLGHPDYENLSLLEAADKGAAEDATAGSLLRALPPIGGFDIKEHGYIRAGTGFLIDALTDPLNLISLGEGAGVRLGGKAVTETPLASRFAHEAADFVAQRTPSQLREHILASKQISALKEAAHLDPALELDKITFADKETGVIDLRALDEFKNGLFQKTSPEFAEVLAHRMMEAERQAAFPFQSARALLSQERELKRSGISNLLAESDAPLEFATSEGSTYQIQGEGTARKVVTPENPAGEWQKPSKRTVYVPSDVAREVGAWQELGTTGKRVALRDDGIELLSRNASKKLIRDKLLAGAEYSNTPETGLHPLELSRQDKKGFYRGVQAGDEITNVGGFKELFQQKRKTVAAEVGLIHPEDIERIYKRPTIRYTGPLAGFPGEIGRLPILGAREADIPIVSALGDRIYQAASEGYYGTILKVKNATLERAQAGSKIAQAVLTAGNTLSGINRSLATQVGGRISRRVQATGEWLGSAERRDTITDLELAKQSLHMKNMAETNFATHALRRVPNVTPEDLAGFHRDAYDLIESNMMKDRPSNIPADIPASMEALETKWNGRVQGLGTEGRKFAERVANDFAVFAEKEKAAGITRNTIEGYVYHMFKHPGGPESPQFKALLAKVQGTGDMTPDFTMDRIFETARKAESEGFVIERDLQSVFAARKFAHDKVMLEKEFAERMAYQHALPKPAYEYLSREAARASGNMQAKAVRALQRYGTNVNPETLQVEIRHWLAPKQTADDVLVRGRAAKGPELTPQNYENLKIANARAVEDAKARGLSLDEYRASNLPGTDARALEQARAMRLNFSDEEKALIEAEHNTWQNSIRMNTGRAGENALARAGAVRVSDFVKERFLKNLTPDEETFWHGALPESFAKAVDESYQMAGEASHYAKRLPDTDSIKKPLQGIIWDYYKKGHRLLKAGQTIYWPAYWVRNLVSSQFQGAYLANAFEQLSIPNVLRAHNILKGADAVDIAGKVIPHRQLMAELVAGNHSPLGTSIGDTANLLTTYGDMIDQLTKTGRGAVPGLKQLLGRERGLSGAPELRNLLAETQPRGATRRLSDWALAKTKFDGIQDKYWEALPNLASRLEAYGRQHLYINLRIAGHDANSATRATNQLLVDYARGKTAFEREFLNNAFFFYSFSRGQATNNFMALMRKPGALSTQYSAIKEFAEMMIDPNTYEPNPDAEEAIRSTRSAEQIATYIGKNPETGQPRLITSLGMPIEDVSKWLTVYTPKSSNMLDIINAAGKTASRTAQVIFSQTNPIAKGIFEDLIFKKNLYFDRKTSDPTLRKIAKWEADTNTVVHHLASAVPDSVWKGMDKGVQEYLGGVDNGDGTWTVNPYSMAVLSYVVPAVVPIVGPYIGGRGLSTRKTLTEPGVPASQKYLRLLLGAHIDEFDPDKSIVHDKLRRAEEEIAYGGLARTKRELALWQRFNPDAAAAAANGDEEEE